MATASGGSFVARRVTSGIPGGGADPVASALDSLRRSFAFMEEVTAWRELPAHEARLAEVPPWISLALRQALAQNGIASLYTHQAAALAEVHTGHDVALATPTASGKSLAYLLPTLAALERDPAATALYLFPTKALARDQLAALNALAEAAGLGQPAQAYDGDTSSNRRSAARESARVLITNPEMLHLSILPRHPRWRRFWAGLRYVVVDEAHQYRGVFGSHVANVLRRLRRVCGFYGATPQTICCSATIGNPQGLAELLTGRDVCVVAADGAPSAQRTLVLVNPPLVEPTMGVRQPAEEAALPILKELLARGVQTIVFMRSRLGVELFTARLRQELAGVCEPGRIAGYRGGYRPVERRAIERALASGELRCVVATSALELGVDIGGMSAAVLIGYPGTIASTWQRAGRAGRREGASAIFVVAGDSPMDQYVITHPEFLLGRSPERALLNPDNLSVLLSHVRCAAYELPFAEGERFGGEDLDTMLAFLEEQRQCRRSARGWLWVGPDYPAGRVALRTADADTVTLYDLEAAQQRTVGTLDGMGAALMAHPGAVYWHGAEQYLVGDAEAGSARIGVRRASLPYYTRATADTRVAVLREWVERSEPGTRVVEGEVRVTTRVTGYRRISLESGQVIERLPLELPERNLDTDAAWMVVNGALLDELACQDDYRAPVASRGSSWSRQRDLARARDGHRCRLCGAIEEAGWPHHVHHLDSFRSFGAGAGHDDRQVAANALENLVTLCAACHARVERAAATKGTLAALAYGLGYLLPVHLMCDPQDLGTFVDAEGSTAGGATIMIYERVAGGIGLSAAAADLLPGLLADVAEQVERCACSAGCPACIGADAAEDDRAKRRAIALARAILCGKVEEPPNPILASNGLGAQGEEPV